MAKRFCFISTPDEMQIYKELLVEFDYYNGFAITQKQKSIRSMHEQLRLIDPSLKVLEVSTKSLDSLGVQLSAFNLKFYDEKLEKEFPIENIFQSSKVFEHGGPYRDLLYVHPKDAKRDKRLKTSGNLKHFEFNELKWEIEPKSLFYDWLYVRSLSRIQSLSNDVLNYNAFTDIEFNHTKSFNCQARSVAIFVSLSRNSNLNDSINNKSLFLKVYGQPAELFKQQTIIDDY